MVRYRRNFIPGGSYFFTVTLRDRRSDLLVRHIDLLRNAFTSAITKRPFTIDAIVVLPDHLHTIWTLPPGDADYPVRWRTIKAYFTRYLRNNMGIACSSPWQSRYWEHTLLDETDFERHVEYIHYNLVKHGHVAAAVDWSYSSFHRYVKSGHYSADWGTGDMV